MRQTVAPQHGAWIIEATLWPDSLLDGFTDKRTRLDKAYWKKNGGKRVFFRR